MKLSLERKIALAFASAVMVLLLVTSAAWWNVVRFQGTHYWVERSRDMLTHLEQANTNILAMQASARGFVLTGSEDMLAPFSAGQERMEKNLAQLQRLTGSDPRQHARLTRLEPLAARGTGIMQGRIAARRARGLEAANDTASYLEGQRTVEEFRRVVGEMIAAERRLLDDRLDRNNDAGRFTVFAIVGATVLAIGFVALAGVVVHRDLLKKRASEAALHESFERIEDLYNKAPCGYHSLDENRIFLAINDTALAWLGYTRSEVVGILRFPDILAPASAAVFEERFQHFVRAGAVQNVEYEWRRKDGTIFPVLLNATAIYDAAGRYVANRATVFDVTRRKRAEEERDRFFTISTDLLTISGFDGFFTRVNPACEHVLGYTSEELLARPQIELVHPDDRERTLAAFAQLAAGETQIDLENRTCCKDGTVRWLHWRARAAPAERFVYASARDITERKGADDRIRSLHADLSSRALQLEAANEELESFSYSVSHDLRAPLRHVDGFAALLAKRSFTALDAEGRRYLATISKSAKQMGTLIDDLLAFSRIGRVPLQHETIDQARLVADVIADGRYDSPEHRVSWAIGALPHTRADAALLRQVWRNLIDNAVKYSSKTSEARVTISGHADDAAGEYVFSVRDNGVGFDMEYAHKLFGVFQRLHGPSEFEGTGIGLANVRRIVKRHGGRTWAEGQPDEGAVFYFSLPITVSPASSSS